MTIRRIACVWTVVVMCFCVIASAKQKPITKPSDSEQKPQKSDLIVTMSANEKNILKDISNRAPLVETYLQIMSPNGEQPIDDRYFVSRVKIGKRLSNETFVEPRQIVDDNIHEHDGVLHSITHLAIRSATHTPILYDPHGFVELLGPDIHGFNPSKYRFDFIGTAFLGDVKTLVYNVEPKSKGKFRGRFWIEEGGHLVRFTGVFEARSSDSATHPNYVHFDSWRTNVRPGEWLPSAVYVEEPTARGMLHGQVQLWGYGLEDHEHLAGDHVSVSIDNAVDRTESSVDVDPLTAWHEWNKLASTNVLDKMQRAGLLSPPGSFDSILDQIATNIMIPNELTFSGPVHCRVLLTMPFETMTVGNTILLSKGLLESLPNEESIASVIAFELAHMERKGNATDTRFSFADNTMFADRAIYQKMPLAHSEEDNVRAADLALTYLRKSMYADKMDNIGLYYRQMEAVDTKLKHLYQPLVGNSLVSPGGRPWLLSKLLNTAPRLEPHNLRQIAALPLGSNILVDPWSGSVSLNTAPRAMPQNANEKRPFEIMPVFYRLRVAVATNTPVKNDTVIAVDGSTNSNLE